MMNQNDENNITVNFKRPSGESVSLSVNKIDKPIAIILQLQQKWPNFKVNQLVFNGNNILNGEKTWSELTKENNIVVCVGGNTTLKIYKKVVNWKFIFSSSPFLVLTLLALILQWHIAFVISFLVISLVLVAIGLWPKIKTCCPREISSSYETENQNPNGADIFQNPNLDQDYQQNQNRNF